MKKLLLTALIALGLSVKAQVPTNGLLAYYSFENNATSHNGLFNLTNLHTSGTAVAYGPGGNGTGYAALFNNTGLQNTTLAAEISSEFTIAYWGYKNPITENNFATRFEMFTSTFHRKDTGSLYGYGISSTNGLYALGGLGGGTAGGGAGGWFHYAMCFKTVGSGKVLEIYANGVLNSSVSISNLNGIYKYNQVFAIGGGTNADGTVNAIKYFDGAFDEFYVYNKALTVTEITNLYTHNSLLATDDFNSRNLKATISPNPTSDYFTIETDNDITSIEIYSLQGQKVLTTTSKNINVSNLSKGMYLIRMEDTNKAVTIQKLIVK